MLNKLFKMFKTFIIIQVSFKNILMSTHDEVLSKGFSEEYIFLIYSYFPQYLKDVAQEEETH